MPFPDWTHHWMPTTSDMQRRLGDELGFAVPARRCHLGEAHQTVDYGDLAGDNQQIMLL